MYIFFLLKKNYSEDERGRCGEQRKKTGKLLRGMKFLVSRGYSMEAKYNF